MTRDTGAGLGLLALAGLYWLGADQIRVSRLEGMVGAQAVPKGLAVSLAILALLLLAQALLLRTRRAGAPTEDAETGEPRAHLRAAGMLLIGMGYLVVVGTVGYMPAIIGLVLATALYLGQRLSARLWLVAVGLAVLYYLIFVRLLGIPLPPGIWPEVWRVLAG